MIIFLTGLIWDDIDFDKRCINVKRSLVQAYKPGKSKTIHKMPKTAAGYRSIPMTDRAYEALTEWKKHQKLESFFSKVDIDGFKDFVFVSREYAPLGQQPVNRAIKRIVDDYNIANEDTDNLVIRQFTSHIIRHTFGTRLAENNVNIKFAQYVLGHKDVQTTIDLYFHLTDVLFQIGKDKMNRMYSKK